MPIDGADWIAGAPRESLGDKEATSCGCSVSVRGRPRELIGGGRGCAGPHVLGMTHFLEAPVSVEKVRSLG
jgi:hypothetical protein